MSKRILILGGGIAGTATAWFLARLGASDVCLVEKEEQLGSQATAQNASILRTWTPDPVTCAMAVEGARFLTRPPAGFSERPLVDRRGLIVSGSRDFDSVSKSYALSSEPAPEVRPLSPSEFEERAPHFAPLQSLEDSAAMLFPNEGTLDVPAVVRAFREGARSAGVRILPGKKVTGWIGETGRVAGVKLIHGERLEADAVVLAAGAWAAELGRLAGSSVPLRPTRRHIVIARSSLIAPRIPSDAPIVWSDGARFYARPEGARLLLSACDQDDCAPQHLVRAEEERDRILARAAIALPQHGPFEVTDWWAGLRTLTPDGRFVIGPDSSVDGLYWAAGLGGHGITTAAAVGRLAAERVLGNKAKNEVERALDPARFELAPDLH